MKTGIAVGDAMTYKPVAVTADVNAYQCARLMAEMHISSVVVRDNGNIIGIVTEQDLVRKILGQKKDYGIQLGEIMSKNLTTITPEKDIYEALILMRDKNVRRLPVVNIENKDELEGFLTVKDILKIQPQLFELLAEKIELREAERKLSSIQ